MRILALHRAVYQNEGMSDSQVYLNGRFVPYAEAGLALHDAGIMFGATVTDCVRTFGGKLFRLDEHLRRFRQSCELCRVPQGKTDEELRRIADEVVARNINNTELAVIMFATPGPLGKYAGTGDGPPTLGMQTFPLSRESHRQIYREGFRLVIPAARAVPSAAVDPRAKQRSRMHWWIGQQQAHEVDANADALLLDENGYVTETPSANLLVVKDGTVWARPGGTVLDGISLEVVRELCDSIGVKFGVKFMTPDDCYEAEELMLTCTTWCLAGVWSLDGREKVWPGVMAERLRSAWGKMVETDWFS